MKELILCVFVVLFIACQNLPQIDVTAPSPGTEISQSLDLKTVWTEPSAVCESNTPVSLNVIQELQNPQGPDLSYREELLRTETLQEGVEHELICVSQLSAEDNLENEVMPTPQNPDLISVASDEELWLVLTEKWAHREQKNSCKDPRDGLLLCSDPVFAVEKGKWASSLTDI